PCLGVEMEGNHAPSKQRRLVERTAPEQILQGCHRITLRRLVQLDTVDDRSFRALTWIKGPDALVGAGHASEARPAFGETLPASPIQCPGSLPTRDRT